MKESELRTKKNVRPLNLRDFPNDLYWKCKVKAAQREMTLKQFIVEVLKKELAA